MKFNGKDNSLRDIMAFKKAISEVNLPDIAFKAEIPKIKSGKQKQPKYCPDAKGKKISRFYYLTRISARKDLPEFSKNMENEKECALFAYVKKGGNQVDINLPTIESQLSYEIMTSVNKKQFKDVWMKSDIK